MKDEDPVAEVRRFRREHAEKFDFDVDRIVADVRLGEDKLIADGWHVVTRKKTPNKAVEVTPLSRRT